MHRLEGASTLLFGPNCCNQMVAQQVEHVGSKMSNRSRKNRSKTRRSYRNDAKDCVEAPLSVKNFFDNNFFSPTSIISPFPLNTEPGPTLIISSYLY